MGGAVGLAVRDILDRIHVRSQATDKLAEAKVRRRTLTDVSSAVNSTAGKVVLRPRRYAPSLTVV